MSYLVLVQELLVRPFPRFFKSRVPVLSKFLPSTSKRTVPVVYRPPGQQDLQVNTYGKSILRVPGPSTCTFCTWYHNFFPSNCQSLTPSRQSMRQSARTGNSTTIDSTGGAIFSQSTCTYRCRSCSEYCMYEYRPCNGYRYR